MKNNTSLEDFYQDLIPVLWEEILFYIPGHEISDKLIQKFKKYRFHRLRDKILVVDYFKGPVVYKQDRDNSRAILKGSRLNKNIHQLLNKKADSNELEFSFVLERYFEQVECLFYIANWMNNNLIQIQSLDDTIKGLFQIQFNHYKAHFETLIKHFFPEKRDLPKGNFDVVKIIESSFPEISKGYNKEELELRKPEALVKNVERVNSTQISTNRTEVFKKTKKQKRILITEKEAEAVLLKRFFNIDLD